MKYFVEGINGSVFEVFRYGDDDQALDSWYERCKHAGYSIETSEEIFRTYMKSFSELSFTDPFIYYTNVRLFWIEDW